MSHCLPATHRHCCPAAYVETMFRVKGLSWLNTVLTLQELLLWLEDSLSPFLVASISLLVDELLRVSGFGIKWSDNITKLFSLVE